MFTRPIVAHQATVFPLTGIFFLYGQSIFLFYKKTKLKEYKACLHAWSYMIIAM